MDKANTLRRLLAELTSLMTPFKSPEERHMHVYEHMKREVAENGFLIMAVPPHGNEPPFAYSIGLTESAKHPELLLFGLPPTFSHYIVKEVIGRIKAGTPLKDGDLIHDVLMLPIAVKSVTATRASKYTERLSDFYRSRPAPIEVLMLVLSDSYGKFPWQQGFQDKYRALQPALWEVFH